MRTSTGVARALQKLLWVVFVNDALLGVAATVEALGFTPSFKKRGSANKLSRLTRANVPGML